MIIPKVKIKFGIAQPTTKKLDLSKVHKPKGKMTKGIIVEVEENEFKVLVKSIDTKNNEKEELLPLTDRSFDLKGKENIFTRKKDKFGKRTRIIRDKNKANFMPGLPEIYFPFSNNWQVKGYIITENNIRKFDFMGLIGLNNYIIGEISENEEE